VNQVTEEENGSDGQNDKKDPNISSRGEVEPPVCKKATKKKTDANMTTTARY